MPTTPADRPISDGRARARLSVGYKLGIKVNPHPLKAEQRLCVLADSAYLRAPRAFQMTFIGVRYMRIYIHTHTYTCTHSLYIYKYYICIHMFSHLYTAQCPSESGDMHG